jgi:hypothetical protein
MKNRLLALLGCLGLVSMVSGCPSPEPDEADAGLDSGPAPTCDTGCDDGVFCNGEERCEAGACVPGDPVVCDDLVACTEDACSEARRACVSVPPDLDGDGGGDASCVDASGDPIGDDCDDSDPSIFSGNVEVCDEAGRDEDCDPATVGVRDLDGDGATDASCCNGASCGPDCNDGVRGIGPAGIEVCNFVDDDCDGTIDEDAMVAGFLDADRDGHGDPGRADAMGCVGAVGFSLLSDDCNDANVNVHGGQPEFCDAIDNDCDGDVDEGALPVIWYPDVDGDGFGNPRGTAVMSCAPIAGRSILATDCNDVSAAISPRAPELCNGIDDDCSGLADFRVAPGDTEDDDRDGSPDVACFGVGGDCNDLDPGALAGEQEICNGRDDDCDGVRDEACVECTLDVHCGGRRCIGNVCETECGAAGGCPDGRTCCDDVCVDTDSSSVNCGACGTSCLLFSAFPGCEAGDCTVSRCRSPFEDCDGVADNGCEIDTTRSTLHCGACGRMCALPHANATCAERACRVSSCEVGWGDCNGIPDDGCEVDLRTDAANCGGCAFACLGDATVSTAACTAGVCRTDVCAAGFQECDGSFSNGCERGAPAPTGPSCRNVLREPAVGGFPSMTGGSPLLVDGDVCDFGTWIWNPSPQVVVFDLGPGAHAVQRLVVLPNANQGTTRMGVSGDGVTWEQVYTSDFRPADGISARDFVPSRDVRFVRFEFGGGFFAPWGTREVEIWECP